MAPAAGKVHSWSIVAVLVAATTIKTACDPAGNDAANETTDILAALLAGVGPNVVQPALERAVTASQAAQSAAEAWRDAELSGDAGAAQLAAQDAWWAFMLVWQELEVYQIGPAASSLTAVGGADLRDLVYSWPTVNRCRVDQETAYEGWNEADFFETSLVNVLGLDALEVLLYSPAGENDCPSQVDINADGTWAALGDAGVALNRAEYAVALSTHAATTVQTLATAWSPTGGDFGAQLATAGESGSVYESSQTGLNAVFNALFYLETSTKDRKLGYATGQSDCTGDTCIEGIESPIAGGSHVWVGVNFAAFRTLYMGGEGTGLDDLLVSIGEESIHTDMIAALDTADAAAAAVTVPFDQADPALVEALYDANKSVTDLLKGDLATVLALQVPAEAAGDSD